MRYLRSLISGLSITVFWLTLPNAAQAAVITQTFDVTATGFDYTTYAATPPVPIDPLTLNFSLTFDPSVAVSNLTSTGLTLNSVNVPYSLPLSYFYPVVGSNLYVGTFSPGPSLSSGFDIALYGDDTLDYARYVTPDGIYADFFPAKGSSVVVTLGAAAVPEPATWAMMIGGLAIAGAALRSRQRQQVLALV